MPDDDDDEMPLPTDEAPAGDEVPGDEPFLDRLRGTAVGSEDPNIVGDVGPTDIPPGTDGGTTPLVTTDQPVDHLEV